MNNRDIKEAKDKDLRSSMAALQRAAEAARKTAIQTGTGIVIHKDGKLVRISATRLGETKFPPDLGGFADRSPE